MPLLLIVTDLVLINLLFYVTTLINPGLASHARPEWLWAAVNLAYIPVVMWQELSKNNSLRAIFLDHAVLKAVKSVGIHFLFFMSLTALTGTVIPFSAVCEFYGLMLVGVPLWSMLDRMLIKMMRRRGRNSVSVVIVGTGRAARHLYDEMMHDAGFGYRVLGFFDEKEPNDFPHTYLGDMKNFGGYVQSHKVDQIFFTLPGTHGEALRTAVSVADDNVIPFFYIPQLPRTITRNYEMSNVGDVPVLTWHKNPLKKPLNAFLKRSFDIVFSLCVLAVAVPLVFIPVSIGIKMSSPGPVFFRQKRTGYLGRTFYCLKFRTMRVNANADKAQATADDPRKTRFGDFLRKTSIDELPQFINVLVGDMSVVGPRPHMLKHTHDYSILIDRYMLRHMIKPGITGWAQVNGYRGLTDEVWKMERRVEYDMWYIEHWNVFLDFKIIVRTLLNAVSGEDNAF